MSTCAFCGRAPGVFGDATSICDPCVGLCAAILAEHVGLTIEPDVPGSQLSPAWIEMVLARLDRRPITEDARCSFCDTDDAFTLIAGPRVLICEACVGGAIAKLSS